jgi:hypothetical protein
MYTTDAVQNYCSTNERKQCTDRDSGATPSQEYCKYQPEAEHDAIAKGLVQSN